MAVVVSPVSNTNTRPAAQGRSLVMSLIRGRGGADSDWCDQLMSHLSPSPELTPGNNKLKGMSTVRHVNKYLVKSTK